MKTIDAIKFAFTNSETQAKAILYTIGLFLFLGIPTALLSTPLIPYIRMIPATPLDYVFLFTTALLAAVYMILPENKICKPDKTAFGGGFLGFLAFGCPICNKLFVLLLGFDFMYNIVNPIRPFLGLLSVAVLIYAIDKKWHAMNIYVFQNNVS